MLRVMPQDAMSRSEKFGVWLGVVAPVVIVVGFFSVDEGGTALPDGSTAEIVRSLENLHARMIIGNTLGMLGGLLLVGFAASMRTHLAKAGPSGESLGAAALAFGTVMTVGALVQGSFRLEVAAIVTSGVSPDAMLPLWTLERTADVLFIGAAGLVATLSIGAFALGLLPRSLGYLGAGLVTTTIILVPTDHGGVGLSLFLWLSAASGFLLSKSGSVSEGTA